MIPAFIDDPAVARADNYRRGKLLTLVVVLGTAALFLQAPVESLLSGDPPAHSTRIVLDNHPLSDAATQVVNFAFVTALIFLFCWFAFRGGSTSTGCLTLFYSIGMLASFFGLLSTLLYLFHSSVEGGEITMFGHPFKGLGREPGSTLSFLALAIWIAFAFWVLVLSSDVKFYRRTRQRGIWLDALPWSKYPPKS